MAANDVSVGEYGADNECQRGEETQGLQESADFLELPGGVLVSQALSYYTKYCGTLTSTDMLRGKKKF